MSTTNASGGFRAKAENAAQAERKIQRDYGGPLIRLHIGLENPDDLIADLQAALAVYAARIA